MQPIKLPKKTIKDVNALVEVYKRPENIERFERFSKQVYNLLSEHHKLAPYIHSMKYRVKDPEHLRRKLLKKATEAKTKGEVFAINEHNLFEKIEDLAGVRILHLHTEQIEDINSALLNIFKEEKYILTTGPVANTWDIEYENFFKSINMTISQRDTMYTSVHYVFSANNMYQTKCELQVRTLMEEVWGEVSHKINYPEKCNSISCQEQIKVLARITSSCTRLVDSIFKSYQEHKSLSEPSLD